MTKPLASLSVDLDNKWSYLRTHGHEGWQTYPSYLSTVVPRMLRVLDDLDVPATIFVVGKDAAVPENANLWRDVVAAGHEIANHSFRHQPWLHRYSRGELVDDIVSGEEAIERATGQRPVGFRGPGFSITEEALAVLAERGYVYDATMFPTFIGPLANLYGRLISRREDPGQPGNRGRMFGSATDGLRTLRPHWLETPAGPLLEIPVTTMPLFRLPIHMTYLHFLAQISTRAAKMYWRCALPLLCGILKPVVAVALRA